MKYLKVFITFTLYNLLPVIISIILFGLLKIPADNSDLMLLACYNFIFDLLMLICAFLIFRKNIKEAIIKTKEKYKGKKSSDFIKDVLKEYLIFFGVTIVVNLIISMIFGILHIDNTTSDNQEIITKLLKQAPLIIFTSACLLGPIMEEIIYRESFGQAIKNKKVFIIVSGLTFGLVHVTDNILVIAEIIIIGILLNFILNSNLKSDNKKVLSVLTITTILIVFGFLYYFTKGNLLKQITKLDIKEVINSVSYIAMGLYLGYIYKKEEGNLVNTTIIHFINNTWATILLLFFK